ncbi:MAG: bifunctional helix-turn-helix transcriptional regulator/GNAT family N-acetyltransferase [Solirubrobacteraceae bacterium]
MAAVSEIAELRAFNRYWTEVVGALQSGLLETRFSLTEARVLYELAQHDATEVLALRRQLGIDPAYLSRIVGRLEADGLVATARAAGDGRKRTAALTARGREAFADLDARSAADAAGLLDRRGAGDRARLLGAMATVRGLLDGRGAGALVVLRAPRPGDLGWVVRRNAEVYADEYGWDEDYEALVARIVADYADGRDPAREVCWIAELAGEPVGCVFCVRQDDETAKLRLLLVDPAARGLGIGGRLVDECLGFARRAGYRRITLWTNDVLAAARRIYERAGFALDAEEPHHSFGVDLVGQTWSRGL